MKLALIFPTSFTLHLLVQYTHTSAATFKEKWYIWDLHLQKPY